MVGLLIGLNNCTSTKELINPEKPTIKSIKKVSYFIKSESEILSREKALSSDEYEIKEFDQNENLLKQYKTDKNGKVKSMYSYAFNKEGHQIESMSMSSTTGVKSYSKFDYIYDKMGRISIKHTESGNQYKPKKQVGKTEYIYENGNLIKEIADEIWLGKREIISLNHWYNGNNKIDSTYHYRDDQLYVKTIYKYDNLGLLMESLETKFNIKDHSITMTTLKHFDKSENITLRLANGLNGYYFKEVVEYNSKGFKTKIQNFKEDGTIEYEQSTEYIYDEFGNWISSISTFSDGRRQLKTERKIEYYK